MPGKFLVVASWWVEAETEQEAINKIEDAVARLVDGADLEDSSIEDEDPE